MVWRGEDVGAAAAAEGGRTAGAVVSSGRKARPGRRPRRERGGGESPRESPTLPPAGECVTPARASPRCQLLEATSRGDQLVPAARDVQVSAWRDCRPAPHGGDPILLRGLHPD